MLIGNECLLGKKGDGSCAYMFRREGHFGIAQILDVSFCCSIQLYVVQSIVIQNTDLMTDSEINFCWKVQYALENNWNY